MSGTKIRDQIRNLLDGKGIQYTYLEHEETKTSEESAKIRGTKLSEGAKAIILKGKKSGKNIMVILPADKRLNTEAIKNKFGEKFEFESPDLILEKFGLVIGAVPPFGEILGIETYIDNKLKESETVAFNCGLRTCSIVMKGKDFVEITNYPSDDLAE